MLGKELLSYVDHTLLRPTATWEDIKEICDAGVTYKTASVFHQILWLLPMNRIQNSIFARLLGSLLAMKRQR